MIKQDHSQPDISVIVAIVDGGEALRTCLTTLANQPGDYDAEAIVPFDQLLQEAAGTANDFPGFMFLDLGTIAGGGAQDCSISPPAHDRVSPAYSDNHAGSGMVPLGPQIRPHPMRRDLVRPAGLSRRRNVHSAVCSVFPASWKPAPQADLSSKVLACFTAYFHDRSHVANWWDIFREKNLRHCETVRRNFHDA